MEQLIIRRGADEIPYTLERKKVKNINVRITSDGQVFVSAPKRLPFASIESFLALKFDWLLLHTRFHTQTEQFTSPADCGFAFYLGKRYPLVVTVYKRPGARLSGGLLQVFVPNASDPDSIDSAVRRWYEAQAQMVLKSLYDQAAQLFFTGGRATPELRLRMMTASFGNCNHTKNRITLNKRLILMPQECIEYVIIHEFCHTLIPNHSPDFHTLVRSFVPQDKERKLQLNELYRIYGQMMQ
ncbi:M48 family metallopeptidase [Zongyangia hominis]|uniref:M48 family metallopeptidase n=1 Tax=Zongyangia hominis TaxID=2763677 RepID=A0A926IAP9_9FIRM|nr:SprT family zinc-dependent metalloprotease [Zongyangia hominis]MBC8569327.1 M48 family metallopeptidase [Zongyangia hominis]